MSQAHHRIWQVSGRITLGLLVIGALLCVSRLYLYKFYRKWRLQKLLRLRRLTGSIPLLQNPSDLLLLSAIEDTRHLRCCGWHEENAAADRLNQPYHQCSEDFQKFHFWTPLLLRFPNVSNSGNAYGSYLFRPILQRWTSKGEEIRSTRQRPQSRLAEDNLADEGITGEHQEFEVQIGAFMDEFFESKAGEEMSTTEGEINKSTARRFQLWQRNPMSIKLGRGKLAPLLTTVAQAKKHNRLGTLRNRSRSTNGSSNKPDHHGRNKRSRSFCKRQPDLDDLISEDANLAREQPMTQIDK